MNRIQNLRKDSGFEVTDKIVVTLEERPDVAAAVANYGEYIANQTLATRILVQEVPAGAAEVEWEEGVLRILVEKS